MAIPESQLETWSNPGALVTSAQAYASIKAALDHANAGLTHPNPEVYLQGSYGNRTNIYAESDVDVVVQHNLSWHRDLEGLPPAEKVLYEGHYVAATYGVSHIRADVLRALQRYFGAAAVKSGAKAIKVTTSSGRTVDVIPALEFRKLVRFRGPHDELFTPGIQFQDSSGRMVVNFPKMHMRNGEGKNAQERTNGRYKQAVRMFKNARSRLIQDGTLDANTAPSYFVECLLYNVPDVSFVVSKQQTFHNVWNYLDSTIRVDTAICQNGQTLLFGSSPEQWNVESAARFLSALQTLWNNW